MAWHHAVKFVELDENDEREKQADINDQKLSFGCVR